MSYLFFSKLQAALFVLFAALQIAFVASAPNSIGSSTSDTTIGSSTSATPSVPTPSSTPSSSPGVTPRVIANGWYASWYGSELPPSQIPWSKYNSLTFAFAKTTLDPSVIGLDEESAGLLHTFVTQAHNNNVHALLSIGGWSGSRYFGNAVATENRTHFIKAVVDLAKKYDLDGINFAWEYPNRQALGGCNNISSDDSGNFLSLLTELRKDTNLTLTAAVDRTPFAKVDGTPMNNVSDFAKVLDYIDLMSYGVWGPWSPTVGPNAPLNDSCAAVKYGSAVSAVGAWENAGFPASKIVLGVSASGQSFHVDRHDATDSSGRLILNPPFDKSLQPLGNSDIPGDRSSYFDQCGNPAGVSGTFDFDAMISAGFLNATGDPASGTQHRFDDCSKTPVVYAPGPEVMISYDDAKSLAFKRSFIKDNLLGGYSLWYIQADSKNILVSSLSDGDT